VGALPRFRLNLFIQAKRPVFYPRRPRSLRGFIDFPGPLWAFSIKDYQQRLLEQLAVRAGRRAHISYAAPAFHTRADLYEHTLRRSVVRNSTFPSVLTLKGHEKWYYRGPGATGIANPNPELVTEQSFLERLGSLARDAPALDGEIDLLAFEQTAEDVFAAVLDTPGSTDAIAAKYMNDLQTLNRLLEPYSLRSTLKAYAQVKLFTLEFDLDWLIYSDVAVEQ
jgi:hypothetical protein